MDKLTKRKAFNFYRSYYDVFNELPEKDQLGFIKALLDKQFLNVEPTDLKGMVKFAWVSQYNSIDQQVKGYKSKTKDPMQGGCVPPTVPPTRQEEGEEEEQEEVEYTKALFLIDWNTLRIKHLNKPSHLNSVPSDAMDNFKELLKNYTSEDFKFALIGLFKQKKMPNDISSMQANPRHFLKTFETYLTAYHDKNTALYGENKKDY